MTALTIVPDDAAPPDASDDASMSSADSAAAENASIGDPGIPEMVLLHVDPRTLIIGPNVRLDPNLDRGLVGSIKDRGVREPIITRRDPDGRLVVRKGQRRTLAAIDAGRDLVPVIVEPDDPTGPVRCRTPEVAAEICRIVDQLGENQHRIPMADTEIVGAHQQLLDLGLSAGQIARRTRATAKEVKASVAVARSAQALQVMTDHQLSLEHAAVLAEFDADPDTVTALARVVREDPERFDHAAQRARDIRADQQRRAEVTAELTGQGITVIDPPDELFGGPTRALRHLRATPDTDPGTELLPDDHSTCPGDVAWIEELPSWHRTDHRMRVVRACANWRNHGHAERHAPAGALIEHDASGTVTGPLAEQRKAERRTVIANNKAWKSATTVRREWLARFLARKTPPADATRWIATTLAQHSPDLSNALPLAAELMRLPNTTTSRVSLSRSGPIISAAQTATAARATMITLGMVLAAIEDTTGVHTWRHRPADHVAYLTALQNWGYVLSDVEQLVLGDTTANPSTGNDPADADPSEDVAGSDDTADDGRGEDLDRNSEEVTEGVLAPNASADSTMIDLN